MNTICVIPARMGSSRFPNKPLTPILGIPMLGHVVQRCKIENIFDRVVVATCDAEIVRYCENIKVEAVMTSDRHERATDRVQEAVEVIENKEKLKFDSVTMVQGDEPMVTPQMLKLALSGLQDPTVQVVNLMSEIHDSEEYQSPNCVKVVTDKNGFALYFSREPIPSAKKYSGTPKSWKQICVIPFRREFLDVYSKLDPTCLEIIESVDMNRVLEHGYKLKCIETTENSFPVDVPEDVKRVEKWLKDCSLVCKYIENSHP